MDPEKNLEKLKITLPPAPSPVGAYVAYKKIDKLVFISGQISFKADGNLIVGKIGSQLTLEDGKEAAKICAINILSQIKAACDGNLSKVKNCIKIINFLQNIKWK